MHLAQAAAEQRGDRIVVLVLFGLGGLRFVAAGQIGQAAHQQIERPGPGVALVADETLRDRQRVARAVRIDAHHLAQQRRDVGKALLGQIATHLGLGMRAGGDPAEHLQDRDVADDHR